MEVPLCTSVAAALRCDRAMTGLPHGDTSIVEASAQERAASEQSEVSSWVPRQAAALVRQRWREARMGFKEMARKPPWRWRVEFATVPSDRRKVLVPDANITLGSDNCFMKTAAGRWV